MPIEALSRYASSINGTLVADGRIFFPKDTGQDVILDLAQNPMIRLENGSRLLMVTPETDDPERNRVLNRFWPDLLIMDITRTLTGLPPSDKRPSCQDGGTPCFLPREHSIAVKQLLALTPVVHIQEKTISITLGGSELTLTLDCIQRPGRPDLLLNFGTLYGFAIKAIEQKGYDIITVPPSEATLDMIARLFALLGFNTTRDPAFVSPISQNTIIIPGLYLTSTGKDLFITDTILSTEVAEFLDQKNVSIVYTRETPSRGT